MDIALYFSAIALGFLGSFHCAGMCGPLVFMLPAHTNVSNALWIGRAVYNAGRIFTYSLLGLLFGLFGLSMTMQGMQRELSVFTGATIIVVILLTSGKKVRLKAYAMANSYASPLRRGLKKLFSYKSYPAMFGIGVLNGLLPCGFVYLAIAGAASTGSVKGAMAYMALFGMGTFPMMMMLSMAASYLGARFRKLYRYASPVVSVLLALFLIYRGTDMKTDDCCKDKNISVQQPHLQNSHS